jgi:murein DD-endopeptidase MepM/ murein hydrolase activator NlpD
MKLTQTLQKALKRHLTIMLVPHTTTRPVSTTFSFSFLIFTLMMWTGLTVWATYIASNHVDYWRVKIDREVIKFKMMFFANELKKSEEMLSQVKEKDVQLRELLEMKTKKAIITGDTPGKGGPSELDRSLLQKMLDKKAHELSLNEISKCTRLLNGEVKDQITSVKEIDEYIRSQRIMYRAMPNIRPCEGAIVSVYGFRVHPITGSYEFHPGLDITNAPNTKIHATANGRIKYTGFFHGYGRLVIIQHEYGYETYYGHMCKILVHPGQNVKRGDLIGLMGETGTTTGIHLHYEVWHEGRTLNPARYLDKETFFKTARN